MAYVFDTTGFSMLGNYYPEQFPSFWERFNRAITVGTVVSVREVYRELAFYERYSHLSDWVESQKDIFLLPNATEMRFVSGILSVPHFLSLVSRNSILEGHPCADPFIIAKARIIDGCVVTEEKWKKNAAKIPNVCKHFEVDCTNIQGFMEREGWTF